MPTNVTAMLKYGTNLLQAVGQFWGMTWTCLFCLNILILFHELTDRLIIEKGHYIIVVAFMSMESSPDTSVLSDYVQSGDVAPDSGMHEDK